MTRVRTSRTTPYSCMRFTRPGTAGSGPSGPGGPAVASMVMYLLMAGVLALRPQGLFPVRHG